MTTGTQIGSDLAVLFNYASAELTTAVRLALINMAVRAAWPKVKRNIFVESSATTPTTVDNSTPTFVYAVVPTAGTVIPEWGVGQVWVTPASSVTDKDVGPVRDVTQYNKDGTWYLRFSKSWVQKYSGETIKIMYQTIPADLTALTDTIPCDPSFCLNYAAYMFATRLYTQAEAARAGMLRETVALWKAESEKAYKMMSRTPVLALPTWNAQ